MWGPSRDTETRTRASSGASGYRTPRPGGGGDAAAGDAADRGVQSQSKSSRPGSARSGRKASALASSGSGVRRERSQTRSSRSLHNTAPEGGSSQLRKDAEVTKLGGTILELGRRQRLPVFAPTNFCPAPGADEPPEEELILDYVYGYSGHLYNQMHTLNHTKVVYCAAAVVVVLDVETNQQQIFRGHSRCVTSIAVRRSQDLVATGQEEEAARTTGDRDGDQGTRCFCCVWRINDCVEEARLHVDDRHFDALEWSQDGGLLFACVADTANERRGQEKLYIWNYAASGHPLVKVMILSERVVGMLAHHSDPYRCSVFGFGHLLYLSCSRHEPGGLRTWGPRWGTKAPHAILCAAYVIPTDTDSPEEELPLAVGTSSGVIMLLQGDQVTLQVQHSSDPVAFLKSTQGSICCGGFDGRLCFLRPSDLKPFVYFEMRKAFTVLDGQEGANMHDAAVLSFALDGNRISGRIVVGTDQNGLWLCHFVGNPQTLDVKPLTLFPGGEALGLDANPAWREEVAVSNSKGTIRFFDILDHVVDVRSPFSCDLLRCGSLRCLAFNRSGLVLAAGSDRGHLLLISTPSPMQYGDDGQHTCKATELSNTAVCKGQITCLQWSSVGDWLVVGASDAKVYLFCVAIDYANAHENRPPEVEAQHVVMSVPKVLSGNIAPITSVQFSACGRYLMSNSVDNQVLFWETSSGCKCNSALAVRDVTWFESSFKNGSTIIGNTENGASEKQVADQVVHPWRCTLGWPLAGLWSKGRTTSRSDVPPIIRVVESAPSRELCAFTDDTHQVCLTRFPAPMPNTRVKAYSGHGAQVSNMCWTADEVLLTVQDGALLQWRVDCDSPARTHVHEEAALPDDMVGCHVFDWSVAEVSPSKGKKQRYFGTPAAPPSTGSHSRSTSPSTRDRGIASPWSSTPTPTLGPSSQPPRLDVAGDLAKLSSADSVCSKLVTRATQTEELDENPSGQLQDYSDVGTCTDNSGISDTPTTGFTSAIMGKEEALTSQVCQTVQSLCSVDEVSQLPTGAVIWAPDYSGDSTVVASASLSGPAAQLAAQLSHTVLPQEIGIWEVIAPAYIRREKSFNAEVLGSKQPGCRMRGVQDGTWVRLLDELGYITVRAWGDAQGEAFLVRVDEATASVSIAAPEAAFADRSNVGHGTASAPNIGSARRPSWTKPAGAASGGLGSTDAFLTGASRSQVAIVRAPSADRVESSEISTTPVVPIVRAPSSERVAPSAVAVDRERSNSAGRSGARSVPTAGSASTRSGFSVPLQRRLTAAHSYMPTAVTSARAPVQAPPRLRSVSPMDRPCWAARATSPETQSADIAVSSRVVTPRGEAPRRHLGLSSGVQLLQAQPSLPSPGALPSALPATPRVVRNTSTPLLRGPPRTVPGPGAVSSSSHGATTPATPGYPSQPLQAGQAGQAAQATQPPTTRRQPEAMPHRPASQVRSRTPLVAQMPLSNQGVITAPPPPIALPQALPSRLIATSAALPAAASVKAPGAPPIRSVEVPKTSELALGI